MREQTVAVISQRRPGGTEVKILKVIPLDVTEEAVCKAQASLDLAGQALRTAGFKAESTVLKDMIIESIVGVAKEWDADLIVLGWCGRTLLKRFSFGSVATRGDTCCSVLRPACEVSS